MFISSPLRLTCSGFRSLFRRRVEIIRALCSLILGYQICYNRPTLPSSIRQKPPTRKRGWSYLDSSNSPKSFSNIGSFLYWSKKAFRFLRRSYCPRILLNKVAILVWFANMSPLTRCDIGMWGDFLVSATCILAGPHGMNVARRRSRILRRDL